MEFNQYQIDAINCDGSAACIATAGSGKTTVLVDRVYRLSKVVPPNRILCIAFSKPAVDNMKSRLVDKDISLKSVTCVPFNCESFPTILFKVELYLVGLNLDFPVSLNLN